MRIDRLLGAATVAAILTGFLALPAAAGKKDALMDEVRAIGDVIAKAMTSGQPERMFGLYAPDAISLPDNAVRMDGVDAFRKHHAEMTAAGLKVVAFQSEPTDVWQAGKQVIEVGTFAIELELPGVPGTVADRGKYVTIYERVRGELKIKLETWNSDLDPMGG